MARGDAVTDIQSIAASGNLDFQPASGVTVILRETGSTRATDVKQNNGSVFPLISGGHSAVEETGLTFVSSLSLGEPVGQSGERKLALTNTIRLRITNKSAAGTNIISYSGLQVSS